MDDIQLVQRMRSGDERAFDEFFGAYFPRLFRLAVRRLGNEDAAEDVVQAVLIIAMRKIGTWRGEAGLLTWLCTICRRELSAYWARTGRQPVTLPLDDHPCANGVDARAGAGWELFSKLEGSIDRRPISATGSEWEWAERAAPPFSVEGKTLGAFLDWVSREGAWTMTFTDRRVPKAARATVLHGRSDLLKGLTPAEALDVVLPTCGLRHRIDGRRVVIERETGAGTIQ